MVRGEQPRARAIAAFESPWRVSSSTACSAAVRALAAHVPSVGSRGPRRPRNARRVRVSVRAATSDRSAVPSFFRALLRKFEAVDLEISSEWAMSLLECPSSAHARAYASRSVRPPTRTRERTNAWREAPESRARSAKSPPPPPFSARRTASGTRATHLELHDMHLVSGKARRQLRAASEEGRFQLKFGSRKGL
jgi:hypothetical protein